MEKLNKIYPNTIEGKEEFVNNVLNTIVMNEGHYRGCVYIDLKHDEYIELIPWGGKNPPRINITANSIEATAKDFCEYFIKIINN